MAPKFGTSGLRGLVSELTGPLVADHVAAFLAACETGEAVAVGRDLRPSSPELADVVLDSVAAAGLRALDCGELPTPALAHFAGERGIGAVMVTGSHIPADRNGLKFYGTAGEITKADEAAILARLGDAPGRSGTGGIDREEAALAGYRDRYRSAFAGRLTGRRLGVWSHSAVGRDLLIGLLSDLGAEVVELGRSDIFVPVDTEAVDPQVRRRLADWAKEHRLDAILSTDGDSDRPLLTDASGRMVPGDILGQLTARLLGAATVVTPVSSNSGAERSGAFGSVLRTRIGSPFVLEAMAEAGGNVIGYEANGGFLLGFEATGPTGPIPPLLTRDAVLPMLTVLSADRPVADLVAGEPARFTAGDRIQGIPAENGQALVKEMARSDATRAGFLAELAGATLDLTDGVRMTLEDGRILHLRPSGNAPEFRVYAEADSAEDAAALLSRALGQVAGRLA